jgi:cathepsin F
MNAHKKQYKSDEEFFARFQIFKLNLKFIGEQNKQGGARFAVNKFADLSRDEFSELYLMKQLPPFPKVQEITYPVNGTLDNTFDWRDHGACTPVKDQGQCGSCWAFSATENIESVTFLKSGSLPVLGPQQIVDCDKANFGCSGGWPYVAYQYVMKQGGQDTEATYPYTARDGKCSFKQAGVAAKLSNWNKVSTDETQIQAGLVSTGPFSICVDASSWQFYSGGVMTKDQCGTYVDHCTQLIGYDTTQSTPFWIVRNSWGTDWGISGIINLEMGKDACLVADYVTTAVSA